jgi:hypothetical protein
VVRLTLLVSKESDTVVTKSVMIVLKHTFTNNTGGTFSVNVSTIRVTGGTSQMVQHRLQIVLVVRLTLWFATGTSSSDTYVSSVVIHPNTK